MTETGSLHVVETESSEVPDHVRRGTFIKEMAGSCHS